MFSFGFSIFPESIFPAMVALFFHLLLVLSLVLEQLLATTVISKGDILWKNPFLCSRAYIWVSEVNYQLKNTTLAICIGPHIYA